MKPRVCNHEGQGRSLGGKTAPPGSVVRTDEAAAEAFRRALRSLHVAADELVASPALQSAVRVSACDASCGCRKSRRGTDLTYANTCLSDGLNLIEG